MPEPLRIWIGSDHRLFASRRAANDNAADPSREALSRAALRLRAVHGPSAARYAHSQCEHAFFGGGGEAYCWWQAVSRTLDKMLMAELPPAPLIAPSRDRVAKG